MGWKWFTYIFEDISNQSYKCMLSYKIMLIYTYEFDSELILFEISNLWLVLNKYNSSSSIQLSNFDIGFPIFKQNSTLFDKTFARNNYADNSISN